MFSIFESSDRRVKDAREIDALFRRHGDETIYLLRQRARDKSLSKRDRRHWKRLLSKAKSHRSGDEGQVPA